MHGRYKTYKQNGCRCEPCREAGKVWRSENRKPRAQRRLPVEPILAQLDDYNRRDYMHGLKRFIGPGIPIFSADHWCIKLGLHPWIVYGDLWFQDIWEGE